MYGWASQPVLGYIRSNFIPSFNSILPSFIFFVSLDRRWDSCWYVSYGFLRQILVNTPWCVPWKKRKNRWWPKRGWTMWLWGIFLLLRAILKKKIVIFCQNCVHNNKRECGNMSAWYFLISCQVRKTHLMEFFQ